MSQLNRLWNKAMNQSITDKALDVLFRQARTHTAWLNEPVEDALLKQVYDLAKMGPTSANMCPMRIVVSLSDP